ncbi:VOC family protein [Marinobacter nanhaiticus D15-8W]|uniref:Glyoxalase/bleomycin resistance/dioxygenase family protein n=1 Tax=Marinobacter nanhaiticus D15-8W TaxID=626887 RepID=N6W6B9_9GAMM|nr:VOC family protein [Marinobacter nanhaiticus]ENO15764.1 glyoxalase/bleomycin resistance/dioxygenase family protein [Marinobacter nanhaiticus D15-8W]BES73378.1 VOC family protein [Marinobacter nanhaiticus D15-8W]
MHANIARYGIILNSENFDECVAFYRDLFGLRELFKRDEDGFRLTCLEYGDGYLMIEQGGKAKSGIKSPEEGSFKLRFNVEDMAEALAKIRAWGIDAVITKNAWGRTINISDPDGNRVGVRDEAGFALQINA